MNKFQSPDSCVPERKHIIEKLKKKIIWIKVKMRFGLRLVLSKIYTWWNG